MRTLAAIALASVLLGPLAAEEGREDRIQIHPWNRHAIRTETLYFSWWIAGNVDTRRLELWVGKAGALKRAEIRIDEKTRFISFKLLEKPGKPEGGLRPFSCFTDLDLMIGGQYEWEFRVGSAVVLKWTAYLYGPQAVTRVDPVLYDSLTILAKRGQKVTVTIDGLYAEEGRALRLRFHDSKLSCKYTPTGTSGSRTGTLTFTVPSEYGEDKKPVTMGSKHPLELRISRPQTEWKDWEPIHWKPGLGNQPTLGVTE